MKKILIVLLAVFFSYTAVVIAQSSEDSGQNDLEKNYEKGLTAHKNGDFKTAFRIFTKLAEQGDAHAQYCLGFMYTYGEGVTKNFIEAYIWSTIAAARTKTEKLHQLAGKIRDNAAEHMTAAQIANAQAIAYERSKKIKSQLPP